MKVNYKQIFAIKNERRKQIQQLVPDIQHKSGIYRFIRFREGKFCVYIGQAKVSVWDRCASHLDGYKAKNPSHIDKSLKKHGIYTKDNPQGWKLDILTYCPSNQCDRLEQQFIAEYRKLKDFVLYNVTIGSQGKGKVDFQERNQEKLKRYSNGKNKGKNAILKEIRNYFDKYLDFVIKGKETKIKARKLQEFKELLNGAENKEAD